MAGRTDNLYCWSCGQKVQSDAERCPFCGAAYAGRDKYGAAIALGAGGIGWSERADDPFFRQYAGRYSRASVGWMFCLGLLIPFLLLVTGQIEPEGEGIGVMLGVPAVIWAIGIIFLLKRYGGRDKSWDGTVTDKSKQDVIRIERVTKYGTRSYREVRHTKYVISFRTQDGESRCMTYWDNSGGYRYLNIGDLVRVHRKKYLKYIEKYDKTQETKLSCAACGYPNDARNNYCELCGAPILKGRAELPPIHLSSNEPLDMPPLYCEVCGARLTGGNFCESCGARVAGSK